jgi:hypothetical protein
VRPLIDLTKKGTPFKWNDSCEDGFNHVKFMLISHTVMAHPRHEGRYILDTDASDVTIGAVLSQIQGDVEKVIAFGSKSLSKTERNYCVTDRELLAIRYFTEYYRSYLLGREFTIRTDHQALKWLFSMKDPKNRVARWIEALSEYHLVIEHRAGIKHGNADAMSRCPNPWNCSCKNFEALRCGPCKKCLRKTELMEGTMPDRDKVESESPSTNTSPSVPNLQSDTLDVSDIRAIGQLTMLDPVPWNELISIACFEIAFLVLLWNMGVVSQMLNFFMVMLSAVLTYRKVILYGNVQTDVLLDVASGCQRRHRKGKLDDTKEDGRTRPKTSLSRGLHTSSRIGITRKDLRSAWPLQTTYSDVQKKQLEDTDRKSVV